MSDDTTHGPIDFVLLEFPGDRFKGEMAAELLKLVEAGTIRLYDVVVVRKDDDGTFSGLTLDAVEGLSVFAGARSGLLSDEDIAEAAEAMEPGTVAALLVYENAWAGPFVGAALRAGGQMIATTRIPATDVIAALDELESQS